MISSFTYLAASSVGDASARLAEAGALPMGGGTDLLVLIKEELAHPESLVDLRRIPGFGAIEWHDDGGLRVGAGVRIADIARDPRVALHLPAFVAACNSVGTPALRNMGTLGGNLCQRPRCWYFRRAIPCLKNGGDSCPAAAGENQYHAVLGGGPCFIVHPSDAAVALTALDARVEIAGPLGTRTIGIEELYVLPAERLDAETVLTKSEFLTAIEIPAHSANGVQHYEKVMQRGAWDFALVSAAGIRRENGDVRMALGGVAPRPWRVAESVEEDVSSGNLGEDDIATLAERALYDARPLSKNGYKVEIAAALLRRAMTVLAAR